MPTLDVKLKGDRPKQTIHTNPDSDADPNYSFRRAHPRNDDTIGEIAKFTDEEIAFLKKAGFEVVYGIETIPLEENSLRFPYLELQPMVFDKGQGINIITHYTAHLKIEHGMMPSDPNSFEQVTLSRLELSALQCITDQKPTNPLQILVTDASGIGVVKKLQEKYPGTKEYRHQRA